MSRDIFTIILIFTFIKYSSPRAPCRIDSHFVFDHYVTIHLFNTMVTFLSQVSNFVPYGMYVVVDIKINLLWLVFARPAKSLIILPK